jgi:hypothetical protein
MADSQVGKSDISQRLDFYHQYDQFPLTVGRPLDTHAVIPPVTLVTRG